MTKKQNMTPEQQKDFVTSMILSAITLGLLYYFLFRYMFDFLKDVFGLGRVFEVVVMIIAWMAGTGAMMGRFARDKAHQKVAYGKK